MKITQSKPWLVRSTIFWIYADSIKDNSQVDIVLNWITKNNKPKTYKIKEVMNKNVFYTRKNEFRITFYNRVDAMLFKLRWL